MTRFRLKRKSIRLPDYDYTSPGGYLVTICTNNRKCFFGEIAESEMILNKTGILVADSWKWLEEQYPYVELDEFIIMPNHLHGIIVLLDQCRGGSRTAPTEKRKPLGRLIGAFKTVSTKRVNILRGNIGGQLWQRGFYEHVVRNYEKINIIREYIVKNQSLI